MPTQNTYVYNTIIPGIDYTGTGQSWTIADGIFVGSHDVSAVNSTFNGSKLINKGDVYSFNIDGVHFTGDNSSIVNKASASIFGVTGIAVGRTGAVNTTITNDGSVFGFGSSGVSVNDISNFVLHNHGEIFGHIDGLTLSSTSVGVTGPMIDNSGLIRSDEVGILVATGGVTTTIVNKAGGTIEGNVVSIETKGGGILSLDNKGKVKGDILTATLNAHDKVVNEGTIKGEVHLGSGNDYYKNAGGKAGKIFGGDGKDKLICGPSTDKLVFDTGFSATNVDTVKHFTPGKDEFFLDQSIFAALTGPGTLKGTEFHIGGHAADTDDFIIYNKNTGALSYDADGTNPAKIQVQFAQLDKHLNLHHSDFIVFA